MQNISASTVNVSNLTYTSSTIVEATNSGTLTGTGKQFISAYLISGSTEANLLEDITNWDINGNYTGGTTITGTYQGQKHYNNNYFFEAIQDNIFIRLIRG